MRYFALIVLFLAVGLGLNAETVLVCHSQVLPEGRQNPGAEASLVDTVFSSLFESGAITFDVTYDATDGVGDVGRLSALANKYGADKIVWIRLVWQPVDTDTVKLEKVSYRVLTKAGQDLGTGNIKVDLESPSAKQKAQIEKLDQAFSSELAKIWTAKAPAS